MNSSEDLTNGYSLKELGLLDLIPENRSNSEREEFFERCPSAAKNIFARVDSPRAQAEHFQIKWGQGDSIHPIILYSSETLKNAG